MIEIALGGLLFTAIVMVLVTVILAARALLVPSGELEITLNGATTLRVRAGGRLLDALAAAGVALPSGCGAKGTCGLCRVRVVVGGGPILPVERGSISRRDAAAGDRLACQVPLVDDLEVRVPDEILGAQRWECTVRSTEHVAPLMRELVLALPPGERMEFRAGAFVQVAAPPYRLRFAELDVAAEHRGEWERLGLLELEASSSAPTTRAYSLANPPADAATPTLVVRLAIPPPGAPASAPPGVVSSWLFGRRPGDPVTISGPFGHFFADESDREMVFIGGGAGMAPMRSHVLAQLEERRTSRAISYWYGARRRRDLFDLARFERLAREHANFRFHVALSEPAPEDAWDGPVGFIHQVVHDEYLVTHPAPEECDYYLCGPPVMVRAVVNMLDRLGVEPERVRFDDFGGSG